MSAEQVRLESRHGPGRDLQRKGLPPSGVRYLSDSRRAVVHGLTGFELWDLGARQIERSLRLPENCRSTSAWTVVHEQDHLVVGAGDGNPMVLDLGGNQVVTCNLQPDAAAFLRDETPGLGSFTSVSKADGSHEDRNRLYTPYTRPCSLSATATAQRILAAYGQAYALLWDLETGELRHLVGSWAGHDELDRIYRVALSSDGRFAATVHNQSGLHIWETGSAKHLLHFPLRQPRAVSRHRPRDMPVSTGGLDGIGPVVFSPGSRTVAVADGDRVREWEVPSGRELVPWRSLTGDHPILGTYDGVPRIHDIRFSEDGGRALTVGVDATLRVRELDTGEQVWASRPAPCCVDWADLSPDGRRVIWVGCPGMREFELGNLSR